jgi:hypothetical protein
MSTKLLDINKLIGRSYFLLQKTIGSPVKIPEVFVDSLPIVSISDQLSNSDIQTPVQMYTAPTGNIILDNDEKQTVAMIHTSESYSLVKPQTQSQINNNKPVIKTVADLKAQINELKESGLFDKEDILEFKRDLANMKGGTIEEQNTLRDIVATLPILEKTAEINDAIGNPELQEQLTETLKDDLEKSERLVPITELQIKAEQSKKTSDTLQRLIVEKSSQPELLTIFGDRIQELTGLSNEINTQVEIINKEVQSAQNGEISDIDVHIEAVKDASEQLEGLTATYETAAQEVLTSINTETEKKAGERILQAFRKRKEAAEKARTDALQKAKTEEERQAAEAKAKAELEAAEAAAEEAKSAASKKATDSFNEILTRATNEATTKLEVERLKLEEQKKQVEALKTTPDKPNANDFEDMKTFYKALGFTDEELGLTDGSTNISNPKFIKIYNIAKTKTTQQNGEWSIEKQITFYNTEERKQKIKEKLGIQPSRTRVIDVKEASPIIPKAGINISRRKQIEERERERERTENEVDSEIVNIWFKVFIISLIAAACIIVSSVFLLFLLSSWETPLLLFIVGSYLGLASLVVGFITLILWLMSM